MRIFARFGLLVIWQKNMKVAVTNIKACCRDVVHTQFRISIFSHFTLDSKTKKGSVYQNTDIY